MKSKAVSQYLKGSFVGRFASASYAAQLTNLDPSHVAKVARGIRKHTGGYGFKYVQSLHRGRGGVGKVNMIEPLTGKVVAFFPNIESAATVLQLSEKVIANAASKGSSIVDGFSVRIES